MRLDLKTTLSAASLERALALEHPYRRQGWIRSLLKNGMVVDLSRIEWVEPSALVKLVLLVEAALREGADVVLRTPRREPSTAEGVILSTAGRRDDPDLQRKAAFISKQVKRRQTAFEALSRWRLWPALQAEHILRAKGKISLQQDFDWSTDEDLHPESSGTVPSRTDMHRDFIVDHFTYRTIFPLRWIGDPSSDQGKQGLTQIGNYNLIDFLVSVLKLPGRGISTPDAQTLAHVFLFELAENVVSHADVPFGLLAVWARPPHKMEPETFEKVAAKDFLPSEIEFYRGASSFPIVEVIVGDSGRGIPAVLGPEFARWSQSIPIIQHGNRNHQIMLWSLDKWSSSVDRGLDRGTRGLYRVHRVVEKWEGELTIRSERELVGIDCTVGSHGQFMERKGLGRFPGTVVHLKLPVKPFAEAIVPVLSRPRAEIQFTVVGFDSATDEEVAINKTLQKVIDKSRRQSLFQQPLVIIVDLGFRSLNRHQLEKLLSRLIQLAHPTSLVLANLGPPGWEALLETAHSLESVLLPTDSTGPTASRQSPTTTQNALLVMEQGDRAKWIGHQDWLCSLLDKMLRTQELPKEAVLAELPPLQRNDQSLRDLAEQWHIIEVLPGGAFRLRYNLSDILDQLAKQMSLDLSQLIAEGKPPAVYSGHLFTTPSQRLVSKYICSDDLLQGDMRRRAIGLLALQVKHTLSTNATGNSIISIVTDEGKARGLADSLREHLGEAEVHPSSLYSKVGRVPVTIPIPSTHQVVIFTDLISGGSLVRNLLQQVIQSNLDPCLVACIVDAREDREKYISIDDMKVPVLSLVHIDLAPDQRASADPELPRIRINPVTLRPESERPQFHYEISPDQLDEMVITSNAMYFDHIKRSEWRHFTIFLDALRLLGQNEMGDDWTLSKSGKEILNAFTRVIDRWQAAYNVDQIDGILYPETVDEDQVWPTAAQAIAQALGKSRGLTEKQIQTIPRKQGSERFLFEDTMEDSWHRISEEVDSRTPDRNFDRKLVVLDWGCLTGKTAQEMLMAASDLGASHALLVFFVSQLPSREERSLSSVSQVMNSRTNKKTEVMTQFITKCGTWSYTLKDCPYCEQLRFFDAEVEAYDPPQFLRDFVTDVRKDFEPKTLQEVRQQEDSLVTTLGAVIQLPLESPIAGIVRMARFRELLREAEGRNHEREIVRRHIQSLVNASTQPSTYELPSRIELIRLAAVEWNLFARGALRGEETEITMARLALSVAQNGSLLDDVRQSAIIVLRKASKEQFAAQLPSLMTKVLERPKLVAQLLYCAFTLLEGKSISRGNRLPQIVDSLDKVSEMLRVVLNQQADKIGVLPALQTVEHMRASGLYRWQLKSVGPMTLPDAWKQLKHLFGPDYTWHHENCRPVRNLFLKALDEDLKDRSVLLTHVGWHRLLEAWEETTEPFLLKQLLPQLSQLRSVFRGRYVLRKVGFENRDLLAEEDHRGIRTRMSIIKNSLLEFAGDRTRVRDPNLWEAFKEARDDLWNLLFSPGETYGEASVLLKLLHGCPYELQGLPSLMERVRMSLTSRVDSYPLSVAYRPASGIDHELLFCHEEVIEQCFEELLSNISKHRRPRESDHADPIPVQVFISKVNGSVRITVANQETVREDRGGATGGISVCKELLNAYGASLDIESCSLPWTFVISLDFQEA
jgi:hypothetical protein